MSLPLAEVIRRDDWDTMEYRAEQSTNRLLDLFAKNERAGDVFRAGLGCQTFAGADQAHSCCRP